MKIGRYAIAIAGFALLMTGGVIVGSIIGGSRATPEPGSVDLGLQPSDTLRLVAVGNPGGSTPTARQLREAVGDWCAEHGCDAIILVGDIRPPNGPTDADDPLLDETIAPYGEIAPTLLAPGLADDGIGFGERGTSRLAAWAQSRENVHFVSPAWSSDLGVAGLISLDSEQTTGAIGETHPTRQWFDTQVRANAALWLVAVSAEVESAGAVHACGRANLVLSASAHTTWQGRCGSSWVSVGFGDGKLDSTGVYADNQPGFLAVMIKRDAVRLRFVGVDGAVRFGGVLGRDGAISLDDGTVLRVGGE